MDSLHHGLQFPQRDVVKLMLGRVCSMLATQKVMDNIINGKRTLETGMDNIMKMCQARVRV